MMQPSAGIVFLVMLTLAGVMAGVVLLLVGRRLRRVDNHPTCRRCRFDLIGLGPEHDTCPECGAALSGERAIRVGNRRAHRGVVALGAVVVLASLLIGSGLVALRVSGADANTFKPVWLLTREARGSGTSSSKALAELGRRMQADALAERTTKELVALGLARQADLGRPWDTAWGDFLDAAWANGAMSGEDRATFVLQGVQFSLRVRGRIVVDAPLGVRLAFTPARLGSSSNVEVRFFLRSLTIGGEDNTAEIKGRFSIAGTSFSSSTSTPQKILHAPLGPQDLVSEWDLSIADGQAEGEMIHRTILLRKPVTVAPAGTPPVEAVTDPRVREALLAKLSVSVLRVREGTPQTCDIQVDFEGLACHLVGEIYLRESTPANAPPGFVAREWLVTPHFLGPDRGHQSSAWDASPLQGPAPLDVSVVDVVFKPGVEQAAGNPDVESMWGEELVIPGVKVERLPAKK
jgi:hypothetical protein